MAAFRLIVAWCLLVLVFGIQSASAVLVTPTGAVASSAFAIQGSATIDSTGLSGAGPVQNQTHDTNENNMWIAAGGTEAQNESLEFTLDQNYDLSSAYVWNYNGVDGFGGDNSLRGIDEVELLVSSSLSGSFTSIGTFNLSQADPLFVPDLAAETLTLSGATNVRRVMFDINSAHGGATQEFVGLSEVRFEGVALPPGPDRSWSSDASGNWTDGLNWDPNFAPNSNTQSATFGNAITAARTVVADEALSVRSITFANTNSYVIAGSGSVTLDSNSGNATLSVTGGGSAGSHQFQAVVNIASNTDITVGSGAEIVFNNALNLNGNTVNKTGAGALTINNQLNTGGGTLNGAGGIIQGGGTVGGNLNNTAANVAPAGILSVNGNYIQAASASLSIDVDGSEAGEGHDQLNVDGTANLSGSLVITPDADYDDPAVRGVPDELVVVVATSVSGSFNSVDYDGTSLSSGSNYVGTNQNGDDGLFRILDYNSDDVTVTNYLAVPGDANGDRSIDGADFMIWSGNKFSAGNGWTTGDFNNDGFVDGQDFLIWNANRSTSVGSATAIPEPSSWGLLIGLVFFVRGWRISARAA